MVELASDWFSLDAAQPPTQLPAARKQRINAFHRSGKVLRYRLPLKYGPVLRVRQERVLPLIRNDLTALGCLLGASWHKQPWVLGN